MFTHVHEPSQCGMVFTHAPSPLHWEKVLICTTPPCHGRVFMHRNKPLSMRGGAFMYVPCNSAAREAVDVCPPPPSPGWRSRMYKAPPPCRSGFRHAHNPRSVRQTICTGTQPSLSKGQCSCLAPLTSVGRVFTHAHNPPQHWRAFKNVPHPT